MFGVTGSGDTSGFSGLQRQPWVELPAQRPYGGYFDEVVDAFLAAYPEAEQAIRKVVVDRDELTIHIAREHIAGVAMAFRNDPALRFELLLGGVGRGLPGPRWCGRRAAARLSTT